MPIEFENAIAGSEALVPLIDTTRGGVIELDRVAEPAIRIVREGRVASGDRWAGLVDRQAYLTTSIRQHAILPVWAYLLLAGVFAIFAWWYEGRRSHKKS